MAARFIAEARCGSESGSVTSRSVCFCCCQVCLWTQQPGADSRAGGGGGALRLARRGLRLRLRGAARQVGQKWSGGDAESLKWRRRLDPAGRDGSVERSPGCAARRAGRRESHSRRPSLAVPLICKHVTCSGADLPHPASLLLCSRRQRGLVELQRATDVSKYAVTLPSSGIVIMMTTMPLAED